jgi:hypothetical protein
MSDFAPLIDRAGQLCRAIASRDLTGHELYILRQSAISGEYGIAEGCEAYTSPCLDLYLREFIPSWRGRGPCLVLNDLAMLADVHPEDWEGVVLTNTVHELAHILDRPTLYRERRDAEPDQLLICEFLSLISTLVQKLLYCPYKTIRFDFLYFVLANFHSFICRDASVDVFPHSQTKSVQINALKGIDRIGDTLFHGFLQWLSSPLSARRRWGRFFGVHVSVPGSSGPKSGSSRNLLIARWSRDRTAPTVQDISVAISASENPRAYLRFSALWSSGHCVFSIRECNCCFSSSNSRCESGVFRYSGSLHSGVG